jgi:hypothetical protein
MSEIKRRLSSACLAELQQLASRPEPNWWKEVLDRKDILLAVRGGYLNVYVRGQSIFKIGGDKGVNPIEIHYKYLVAADPESGPYVSFNGDRFDVEPDKVIHTRYQAGTTLAQLVRNASRFAGPEKTGVARIAANEPKVVDVEIAFGREEDDGTQRMDLAVLVPWDKGARLVFCEAKCADNVELWKPEEEKAGEEPTAEPRIAVVGQIDRYEAFIRQHESALADAYVSVCRTLKELHAQGYRRHGDLDALVQQVADGEVRPEVHPHVYLLVFGYDADQKKGAVKRRLEGLRSSSEIRVIDKGDPASFHLAADIRRREGLRP